MRRPAVLVLVLVLALGACAEASGEPRGGGLTDAGLQAATPGELTLDASAQGAGCGEGATWTSLYEDIFGRNERPGSCGFSATCHGSADANGAVIGGFRCFDKDGCRQSLLDRGLVGPAWADAPERAPLFETLRVPDNPTGRMPKAPTNYVYPEACVLRMKSWIAAGSLAD